MCDWELESGHYFIPYLRYRTFQKIILKVYNSASIKNEIYQKLLIKS